MRIISVVTFCLLVLIGCNNNGNNLDQAEPNNDNQTPQQVDFGPNNQQGNDRWNQYDNQMNPRQGQNFFQNPNTNQWQNNGTADRDQGTQTEPNRQTESNQQQTEPNQQTDNGQNSNSLSEFQSKVVTLTNQEREQKGLQPLKSDKELTNVAQTKAEDMATNNYFSHTSPTYGSPFNMMQDFGIQYTTAAENLAQGQKTPKEVVNGWMNSPGHRKNILNKDVTHIGIGFAKDGNYWTQMFIKK
ncbi:CAP domain-containing protein [Aquibacillus sp. 3ASR75-11]|uniref:CAP domain-containing protein n=1 Tax=Terrihalobacillus insolitus TaxID=2950438 RepID=A0A9X3WVI5_9BACI|nr:CAP domain-containing protein [Terrihalobacillus insolitus]MDC3413734.1 CAP domain-containing protein [Terrihalobacillus insolitus]MDC3425593.1 CAP domain-containing protein [Terrihalobacillus insolitus]